jgi:hypothetical protein
MHPLICDAIRARRLLRFVYEGYERIIEPHSHGINSASREVVSGWLVGGWTRTDTEPGWRNYLVGDMQNVHVLAEPFPGPRPGFNPRTPQMRQIFCELEVRERPQPRGQVSDPEVRP